ncbi:MAG: hypothetical protein ACFE8M_08150 [Candidatus Hermodarchaeota archaeon]
MAAKGKALVGPIIGIIGSAILLIAAFIAFGAQAVVQQQLTLLGITWADIGVDPMIFTLRSVLTLVFALLGLIGAIIGFLGKRIGAILMLIGGIVAVVGLFIPIGAVDLSSYIPGMVIPIPLTYSMFWVDPFIILVGGILGLVLKAD